MFDFIEEYTLSPLTLSDKVTKFIKDSETGYKLDLLMDITFAGLYTKNDGLYLPQEIGGTVLESLTNPHPLPILKDHNPIADNQIGRIVSGKYIDLTLTTPKDSLVTKPYFLKVINDTYNLNVKDPEVRLEEVNKFMVAYEYLNSDKNYKGTGVLRAHVQITDPDSIKKVLRGEFLTVSGSYSPETIICSDCGRNFKDEGSCEHEFGAKGPSGRIARWIPLGQRAKEVSFVPIPAVNHAKVFNIGSGFPSLDSVKYKSVSRENAALGGFINFSDKVIFDSDKKIKQNTIDIIEETPSDNDEPSVISNRGAEEHLMDYDGVESLETLISDYSYMERELDALGFSDAKLSTKARNKLSNKSFCGPQRSFPVPDCPHHTAALRMIGRYKGPGDKSRILACVKRKGKAMGCPGASDSKNPCGCGDIMKKLKEFLKNKGYDAYLVFAEYLDEGIESLTADQFNALAEDAFLGIDRTFPVHDEAHKVALGKILEECKDENDPFYKTIAKKFTELKDSAPAVNPAADSALEALRDENENLKLAVETITRDRDQLKQRLTLVQAENQKFLADKKDGLVQSIVGLKVKAGLIKAEDVEAEVKVYETREMNSLEDTFADLNRKSKPGIAAEPTEGVINPVPAGDAPSKEKTWAEKFPTVKTRYDDLKRKKSIKHAEDYLRGLKADNLVPSDLTFED